MKRIRVAPGKFVSISAELADKAARVFGTGLTRDQVRDLKASEPRRSSGLMAGSSKPLALARSSARAKGSALGASSDCKSVPTGPGEPKREQG